MAGFLITNDHSHYIVLAAVAVAALGFSLVYQALASPLAKIPGPWYSKFTRSILTRNWLKGKRSAYVHDLHQKYGPVVRIAPDEVDIMDVTAAKEIHTVKATYVKSPFYKFFAAPGTENVFGTTDINFHRRHRKLLQGPFSETSLKAFHPIVEERVNLTIQRMGQESATRGAADVFKWWLFMATDVIGELSFGESFRMLELGKKNEYSLNLEKIAFIGAKRATFSTLSNFSYYTGVPIPGFGDSNEVFRKNLKYATESLQRYQRLVEKDPENPPPTLFSKLFKGEEEGSLPFKEILDEAMGYIIAGSDTTAVTLTYLVWCVCGDPDIKQRLVQELQKLPDDYSDGSLRQLSYLNQVITETLRLHCAAPSGLPRVVPPGGSTLGGHYLPGGSVVCTQAYSLHRNADIFPDPDKFDPSRWASPTREMKDSFMPFGGGSRICIGLHLAELELRLATARFFRAFPDARMSTLEGMSDDDMEEKIWFLTSPKNKRCLIECS